MPSVRHGLILVLLALLATPSHGELSITRGSAGAQPVPQTGGTPEWVYTLKPGESFGEVAQQLLAGGHGEAQLRQYNGIDNAAVLDAGATIRIPLSWLKRQPEPARVTAVSGTVQRVSGYDRRKSILKPDTLIRVGDEILSGAGTATIVLADGSVVRLSPNSRLLFNRLTQYGKSGMVDTRLRLDKGEVHTRVQPLTEDGARFEIETPSAVAAVRGTAFTLQTEATGTHLQVTEGVVDFGKPGRTRRIPAGYSATVGSGSAGALAIRRLPPAPELEPLPETVAELPLKLAWKPAGAPLYRLDVFEQDTGRWIENRKVSGSSFELGLLDNGHYEIQLAALDSHGLAGIPAVVPVSVALQARKATLVAPEPGATANDDMPEFRWQFNGHNEVARVEISEDDSFRQLIATSEWAPETSALPSRPLSPGQYYWRVVTEAGGTSVAASEPRTLVVNGSLPPTRIISVNYLDNQVRIFWEKVDTATGYHLQLSEEPQFHNIIKEATVTDTTAALRLIPGRRYFVRLKALSDGPLTSRWGPGRELYLD
ncbi:FecR family protein [uncultured Marinobacter sp.]|uniref:FecR family protein n=1 Tax=uncultured Marinobacter sp. TaxID=187379 RepID=UPI000C6AD565|nr:peptidoglycan-binding protein LysM [Oceanospirillales bacterium]